MRGIALIPTPNPASAASSFPKEGMAALIFQKFCPNLLGHQDFSVLGQSVQHPNLVWGKRG